MKKSAAGIVAGLLVGLLLSGGQLGATSKVKLPIACGHALSDAHDAFGTTDRIFSDPNDDTTKPEDSLWYALLDGLGNNDSSAVDAAAGSVQERLKDLWAAEDDFYGHLDSCLKRTT